MYSCTHQLLNNENSFELFYQCRATRLGLALLRHFVPLINTYKFPNFPTTKILPVKIS